MERFDESDLAQLNRLASERLRHERLVARGLLRLVLSHYTGVDPGAWRFLAGAHGKPAIGEPAGFESLHFNLTHTEALVVCAASRAGELGVDAEETSRSVDIDQVSRHFFSASERKRLAELPGAQQKDVFFEQWVLTEAYLKGLGTGLTETPEGVTIGRSSDGKPLDFGNWQFALARPTPRHVAAVAVHRHDREPIRVEWRTADGLM